MDRYQHAKFTTVFGRMFRYVNQEGRIREKWPFGEKCEEGLTGELIVGWGGTSGATRRSRFMSQSSTSKRAPRHRIKDQLLFISKCKSGALKLFKSLPMSSKLHICSNLAYESTKHLQSFNLQFSRAPRTKAVRMPGALVTKLEEKLTLSKDPEGDNDMSPTTESSNEEEEADNMFPAANDNTTAPNTQATLADQHPASGELSPPLSQDPPDLNEDEAMDLGDGNTAWETTNNIQSYKIDGNGDGATQDRTVNTGNSYKPGGWDTPKAREEYQRHWHGLLDKNFSLSKEAFLVYDAAIADD